ncbi:nucleoside kinase [Porphyromonas levii]|uniref:Nucleoside kinase n=1 Tax=Porphyromonas levii TaxID=28114 RepID=A0A4Y8WNC1_9PORP|nr:nucleoside kinase [Porphyromonas levii]MBR8704101.1 Uridine kinase [Porphyromonas levii]MBR8712198.1 Uridine kinase [Porphyromonas levii]MBR8714336.1 Uridine kinase [Porphyromonas levii]MBR8726877.1 Uridine kinase [Porphyromonas levii]MBR8728731.1 Uridine kinase [Porphyromonas levii]
MYTTKEINIRLEGSEVDLYYPIGITPFDIFQEHVGTLEGSPKGLPMLALVNNKPTPLSHPLHRPCQLSFVGYETPNGRRTYTSTVAFILYKAAADLGFPPVVIEHALSNGYYGIIGSRETHPTTEMLEQLSRRMREIISADLPIDTTYIRSNDAIEYFQQQGRHTTADLLTHKGEHYVRLVEMDGYRDYTFEPLLPSTGMIWDFGLDKQRDGFLLRMPNHRDPEQLYDRVRQPKQFGVFKDHLALLKLIGVEDVAPLNQAIREGRSNQIITLSEALQEKEIASIASEIASRYDQGLRVVLLSGPSSSGKTTTAKRLSTQLIANLIWPYAISLDDYYINRVDTPLDEFGNYDYESLYAIDLPKLRSDIELLMAGEEVQIPTYNFVKGEREYRSGSQMKLENHGILIMEGIHALNPELLQGIPDEAIYRIYVSALTPLSIDSHNWISTSDNRLIRRMVRDMKFRGTSAEETIMRWTDVRRGEEKWIFPYQENADIMFNSGMLYELAALKSQAVEALNEVQETSPAYPTASRLLEFLNLFESLPFESTPLNSLLREFLGGSAFDY